MDTDASHAQEPVSAAAAVLGPGPRSCGLQFTGTGAEYFGIWIVNLLLTIATLGIYSAWAKVRKLQYFYRNTRLDGSVFDYHGNPIAILKGRLLAVALLGVYQFAPMLSGALGPIAALAVLGSVPWFLTQSYRFRLHNSSYRGLRFSFAGPVWHAYLIFGLPAIVVLTPVVLSAAGTGDEPGRPGPGAVLAIGMASLVLMLLWPYLHFRFKRWQHGHAVYGTSHARFEGYAGDFYGPYVVAAILFAGLGLVSVLVGAFAIGAAAPGLGAGLAVVRALLLYVAAIAIARQVAASIQNTVWSRTRLEGVRISSDVRAGRLIGITLSNLAMIVLSLGLLIPFAVVRQMKYRIESIRVLEGDELAGFVANGGATRVGASGEGTVDVMDLDMGL